jgi:hypothetical protein
LRTGTLPGWSGEQAKPCQPLDAEAQDRLMRAGGGQADPDALLEFIDAGGDLDQAQADRVELGSAPQGERLGKVAWSAQTSQYDAACRNRRNWLAVTLVSNRKIGHRRN